MKRYILPWEAGQDNTWRTTKTYVRKDLHSNEQLITAWFFEGYWYHNINLRQYVSFEELSIWVDNYFPKLGWVLLTKEQSEKLLILK